MTGMIKNIIVVMGLVALAAVGYYLFVADRSAELTGTASGGTSSVKVETQSFLNRLSELENIRLSGNIFNDRRFRSLQDYSTTVIPSAVGRVNPFEAPGTIRTVESN